jgi:hypothetical protein
VIGIAVIIFLWKEADQIMKSEVSTVTEDLQRPQNGMTMTGFTKGLFEKIIAFELAQTRIE